MQPASNSSRNLSNLAIWLRKNSMFFSVLSLLGFFFFYFSFSLACNNNNHYIFD